MLTLLTWLELGIGVTDSPYATASLALMMVVMSTLALVAYKDKAFCRYFCPVGRTIGVYSQLSPIALRPVDETICQSCTTLDCYHGNETIAPCPTNLVMGRLQESTYCISCGNCTQSCPSNNINWQLRPPNTEAKQDARPHTDEACFMIGLLGLTSFHGLTMLPMWQQWISQLARFVGDSGSLIFTFTIILTIHMVAVFVVYTAFVSITRILVKESTIPQLFNNFAFASLPIAFAYHLAHNLNHFLRESGNLSSVIRNPLGLDTLPLSMLEKHQRAMDVIVSTDVIWLLQAAFLVLGFCLSIQVLKYRGYKIFGANAMQLIPMVVFSTVMTGASLWLLCQPMTMRM
jgi:ferredoxin